MFFFSVCFSRIPVWLCKVRMSLFTFGCSIIATIFWNHQNRLEMSCFIAQRVFYQCSYYYRTEGALVFFFVHVPKHHPIVYLLQKSSNFLEKLWSDTACASFLIYSFKFLSTALLILLLVDEFWIHCPRCFPLPKYAKVFNCLCYENHQKISRKFAVLHFTSISTVPE